MGKLDSNVRSASSVDTNICSSSNQVVESSDILDTETFVEESFVVDDEELIFDKIMSCLGANHANTLIELDIIRACITERNLRKLEEEIPQNPAAKLSQQNPHTLIEMLVDAGALERIIASEAEQTLPSQPDDFHADGAEDTTSSLDAVLPEDEELPHDYLLRATPAGLKALEEYKPTKRFSEICLEEPSSYLQVYGRVLELCENGARREDIEKDLDAYEAMHTPKVVYAGHFISNLETVGGIAWQDGLWRTTEHGQHIKALCC